MIDKQLKNVDWNVADAAGNAPTWDHASIAVLMDIRRELRQLNTLLSCRNFTEIPMTLRQIRAAANRIPRQPKAKKKVKV